MDYLKNIKVDVIDSVEESSIATDDSDTIIFDYDSQIDSLSNKANLSDYIISAGSGILSSMLDIFWVGDFSLSDGRDIANDKVENFVKKVSNKLGCESNDLQKCVRFLEKRFPIPADGNTADFGGGLQHHLRDFTHHPTIVGLFFSIISQFTEKTYGTDTSGSFIGVNIPNDKKFLIGRDIISKIFNGTIIWFFHLVSDMAGSSGTVMKSGGTGIPGPILSFAKELSSLPFFKDIKKNNLTISQLISKAFNGTLFAKHDENGKIIKESILQFDLRGELGFLIEMGKQAVPVIANECIVRVFYFIRQFAKELKSKDVNSLSDFKKIDVEKILPRKSQTLTRMLTIATGVFTTLDVSKAIITKKYWVSINYIGAARLLVSIGDEIVWALKRRDVKKLKAMYERIERNTFTKADKKLFDGVFDSKDYENFGLTLEETEILFNIEYLKIQHDIDSTKNLNEHVTHIKSLKIEWLKEWKGYISNGFPKFINKPDARLNWYSPSDLNEKIQQCNPWDTWFRLVLLEAMLFEPYFPLSVKTDKNGKITPSKHYLIIDNKFWGYKQKRGDKYLDDTFSKLFPSLDYVQHLRNRYNNILNEIKSNLKSQTLAIALTAAGTLWLGVIPFVLVLTYIKSQFPGLNGAALTSTFLAFSGGGVVAVRSDNISDETKVIAGGSAVLGVGVGNDASKISSSISQIGKNNIILQSIKLVMAVEAIFLDDEWDIEYSKSVYEKYEHSIKIIEKGKDELKHQADIADNDKKKKLNRQVKLGNEIVNAMKIAMKNMKQYIDSFEEEKNVFLPEI